MRRHMDAYNPQSPTDIPLTTGSGCRPTARKHGVPYAPLFTLHHVPNLWLQPSGLQPVGLHMPGAYPPLYLQTHAHSQTPPVGKTVVGTLSSAQPLLWSLLPSLPSWTEAKAPRGCLSRQIESVRALATRAPPRRRDGAYK
ncbi:hypothetical protein MTO96_041764 [Rhipicephalus appendiculatus]